MLEDIWRPSKGAGSMRAVLAVGASLIVLMSSAALGGSADSLSSAVGQVQSGPAGAGVDTGEECEYGLPQQVVPAPGVVGLLTAPKSDSPLTLDVLVVTERTSLAQAKQLFTTAKRSYQPLGIALVPRFRVVKAVPDLRGDANAYLKWLKKQVGGRRPSGVDVVYLATARDIFGAGLADCIGGIAYPEHAFAVGMLTFSGLIGVEVIGGPALPRPPLADGGAKLAAHEIGHLLGAEHYVDACRLAADPADPSHPCDVMFTLPQQATGLRFGPVNAAIVRDHTVRFTRP